MILRQCPRVIRWKTYRQTLWEWSHLFWSLANLQYPCDVVDTHTAASECSSLSPSSPWCCPRKPITDRSSLVTYRDSPSLGNTDTNWRGQILIPMWYLFLQLQFWWTALSSHRSAHLCDCHFLHLQAFPQSAQGSPLAHSLGFATG